MTEKKRVVKFICNGCVNTSRLSEFVIDFAKLPKELQNFLDKHSEVLVKDSVDD